MNRKIRLIAALLGVLVLSSCVSVEYQGRSFPPVNSLRILQTGREYKNYEFIGWGHASGEYSGTSNAELRNKLYLLGLQHGAEAVRIIGVRLVPAGHVVNMADYNFIEATDDPDQTWTETDMQEVISGDPNSGYTRYKRIMYAEYYRKKTEKKL